EVLSGLPNREDLAPEVAADPAVRALTPRGRMIAVYALCGFANLGSVGIQMGAMAFLAPNRRASVAALAMKAMIAGTLAAFMTACIAGMLADPTVRLVPPLPKPAAVEKADTPIKPSATPAKPDAPATDDATKPDDGN
ncbi:MAG: nucleoside transporter C-terminal domain-containing protein, partial [Planctomycetota bacterium]